jgi:hypothetical protein
MSKTVSCFRNCQAAQNNTVKMHTPLPKIQALRVQAKERIGSLKCKSKADRLSTKLSSKVKCSYQIKPLPVATSMRQEFEVFSSQNKGV